MSDWYLRVDPPLSGAENMAEDERLLHWLEELPQPASVLRLYSWSVPTVSLGRHQGSSRSYDAGFCWREGIPVVRRPTGGRAVLHAKEMTYAVVSNDADRFPVARMQDCYRSLAKGLQHALALLGIHTLLAPKLPLRSRDRIPDAGLGKDPCFASASRHELLHQGRKIVGSAQRRLKRAFLQHGSVPVEIDYERMAAALATEPSILRQSMTSLSEAAGRTVAFKDCREAFLRGFQEAFTIERYTSCGSVPVPRA